MLLGGAKSGGIHTNHSQINGTILSVGTTRSTSLKLDTDTNNSRTNCPPTFPRIPPSCSHSRVQKDADTFIPLHRSTICRNGPARMDQDKPINLIDILTKPFCFTYASNTHFKATQFFHQQVDLLINLDTSPSRRSSNRALRLNK